MISGKVTKSLHQISEVLDFAGYDEELLSNRVLPSIFSFISLVPGRTEIGIGKLTGTDPKIVGWHARKLIENKLVEYDKEFSAYYEYGVFTREEKRLLNYASKGSSYFIFRGLVKNNMVKMEDFKNFTKTTIERRLQKLLDYEVIYKGEGERYILSEHGSEILKSIAKKQVEFNFTLLLRLRQEKMEIKTIIRSNQMIIAPSIGYPFILSINPAQTLIEYGES